MARHGGPAAVRISGTRSSVWVGPHPVGQQRPPAHHACGVRRSMCPRSCRPAARASARRRRTWDARARRPSLKTETDRRGGSSCPGRPWSRESCIAAAHRRGIAGGHETAGGAAGLLLDRDRQGPDGVAGQLVALSGDPVAVVRQQRRRGPVRPARCGTCCPVVDAVERHQAPRLRRGAVDREHVDHRVPVASLSPLTRD